MKSKLVIIGVVVVFLLSLVACSPKQASVEVSCNSFSRIKHFTQQVTIPLGRPLKVTLCSNPTTGFQWSELAQISNETVLKQTDHEFAPPKSDVPGAAGKEIWTFKALKKGETTISMEWSQPWEGGVKAEWTFIATITIE